MAAVIDIGSNSVLLLTVRVGSDGRARVVDTALATTRLGTGLRGGGRLDPAARAHTLRAVEDFSRRARAAGAETLWALATAAVREAVDGTEFAREVGTTAGVFVDVLTAAQEGRLAYAAVADAPGTGPGLLLAADVGGRTTELTLGVEEQILDTWSLPLGALALTETFLRSDPTAATEIQALVAAIDAALQSTDIPARARAGGAALVVSGGTATALAAVDLDLASYEASRVHGHRLERSRLRALGTRLAGTPAALRGVVPGIDQGRGAILPAGAYVLERLIEAVGVTELTVSDHGVRHAYLRSRLAAAGVRVDMTRLWG